VKRQIFLERMKTTMSYFDMLVVAQGTGFVLEKRLCASFFPSLGINAEARSIIVHTCHREQSITVVDT
jgi:hypothetical protein